MCYTRCESFGEVSVMAKRKRDKQRKRFWKRLREGTMRRLKAHEARTEAGQPSTPIKVEFVKSRYSPTKAELEEDMRLPEDDGIATLEDLEEMGRALVHPVDVTWRDKPRKD